MIIIATQCSYAQQKDGMVIKSFHKKDTLTILREGVVLPNDVIARSKGELMDSSQNKKTFRFLMDPDSDTTGSYYLLVTVDAKSNAVIAIQDPKHRNEKSQFERKK
jgi:hypothetical protein